MKKLKLTLLTIVSIMLINGCDQAPAPANAQRSITEVVALPHMSQKTIMNKINLWIAERASSYQNVVQYHTGSSIVVKANVKFPCEGVECIAKEKWRLWFMLKVDTKPSKMRVSLNNFEVSWSPSVDSLGYHEGHRGPIYLKGDLRNTLKEARQIKNDLIMYVKSNQNTQW